MGLVPSGELFGVLGVKKGKTRPILPAPSEIALVPPREAALIADFGDARSRVPLPSQTAVRVSLAIR